MDTENTLKVALKMNRVLLGKQSLHSHCIDQAKGKGCDKIGVVF